MPIIRLKPHDARLVIEDGSEMILVVEVSLHEGEHVALASGGQLESLSGTLRVHERGGLLGRTDGRFVGKLSYVADTQAESSRSPGDFQIDATLGPREFRVLIDLGRADRLPHTIFVQVPDRSRGDARGLTYRSKGGRATKYWDNVSDRRLPVSNLTYLVPLSGGSLHTGARTPAAGLASGAGTELRGAQAGEGPLQPGDYASAAQLAELADELHVYQGEIRHLLTAVLVVMGLTALIVVVVSLMRLLR
jgi:hypothetical protein